MTHRLALIPYAALATLLLPHGAPAQTAPPAAAATLERVEVTGSRIKRVDSETASPVQIIDREAIERTGAQSIQEVLRGITADGSGSISSSFSIGFAAGSAAVSLRGLGVNSTLVLVNGRRMTTYGLADDGVRSFVDLNSLPLEAVERIEVLKDGASAIYGADAVGGVVNVILRRSYSGASIGATTGATGRGDGQNTRVHGTAGFGDLDRDRYNVFFSLEVSKQKSIQASDRGFLGESDLRGLGYFDLTNGATRPYFGLGPTSNSPYGVTRAADGSGPRVNVLSCDASLIDPTTGLCRYNPRAELEIQPRVERLNFYSRGTLQFSSDLSAYAEVGYFRTKMDSNFARGANNDGGVFNPRDLNNPLIVHSFMTLPAAHPDNTFGVDRALFIVPYELGGRDQNTDNHVLRLVEGLQGSAYGWDFDIGASYIRSKLYNENLGFINYDAMQAALNDGSYRIGRAGLTAPSLTDPAVLARISPTLANVPVNSIKALDAKASRELATLAGGPLGLAIGAETRWEASDTPPVPGTESGAIVGLGYYGWSAKRRVQALYGELNAPLTKWLELSGALRTDRYSDFGSSTNPKLGFKLRPIEELAVRGTYAEAFRAPGPSEIGGSAFGFTSFGILTQGNPDIKPERAKSYTLGLVFEPIAGASVSLDYWRVNRRDEILAADPALIIGDLPTMGAPNSRIAGTRPGSFIYYDGDGAIATVTDFYRNAGETKTDGVDLELRHRLGLGDAGRLSTQLNWTHVNSFERDGLEYAGTHGPLSQSAGGGTPKNRLTLSSTWERGAWAVTGAVNHVGSLKLVDHEGETTPQDLDAAGNPTGTITNPNTGVTYPDNGRYDCGVFDPLGNPYNGCKLPSFTTFDLVAKWTPVKSLDLTFSVQNLFDRKAPFDPYLSIPYVIHYNQTWHQAGAVGRAFTIGAKYTY